MNGAELWVITSTEPVTWAVPFWSEGQGTSTDIRCGMCLTPFQFAAVKAHIGENGLIAPGHWRLTVRQLRALGHQVQQTGNPEDHFVWERARTRHLGAWSVKRRKDRDEFLAPMFLRGIGSSMWELEYWLNQFCNAMVWHLINKETPIDLYFCRLHPSPFRLDWHKKFLGPFEQGISRNVSKVMADEDQRRRFANTKLLAWDGRACLRGIELEHTRTWWRLSRRAERERVRMLTRKRYAADYISWVERRTEQSVRLHMEWLAHQEIKSPGLVARRKGGASIFRFDRFQSNKGLKCRLAEPEREREIRDMEKRKADQKAKAKHMREMRAIQLRSKDLRNGRRCPKQSIKGQKGISGAPVPPAEQILTKAGDVLADGGTA